MTTGFAEYKKGGQQSNMYDAKMCIRDSYGYGGGISYGYNFFLGIRWSIEANLGIGYARSVSYTHLVIGRLDTCYSPVRRSPSLVCKQTKMLPLDLHVLSL